MQYFCLWLPTIHRLIRKFHMIKLKFHIFHGQDTLFEEQLINTLIPKIDYKHIHVQKLNIHS